MKYALQVVAMRLSVRGFHTFPQLSKFPFLSSKYCPRYATTSASNNPASPPPPPKVLGQECSVTWIVARTGETKTVIGRENQTLLEVARAHDIPLEGACEGACRCSTCHIQIQQPNLFDWIDQNQPATDEENDMLDQAFDLQSNSRLGCQVTLHRSLNGITAKIPEATRNLAVDGYVPKHH